MPMDGSDVHTQMNESASRQQEGLRQAADVHFSRGLLLTVGYDASNSVGILYWLPCCHPVRCVVVHAWVQFRDDAVDSIQSEYQGSMAINGFKDPPNMYFK